MAKRLYQSHFDAVKDDVRFRHVTEGILAGRIQCMSDLFEYLPKSVLAVAIGRKVDRFNTMMAEPDKFYVGDIKNMAILFEVSVFKMFVIVYNQAVPLENSSLQTN